MKPVLTELYEGTQLTHLPTCALTTLAASTLIILFSEILKISTPKNNFEGKY